MTTPTKTKHIDPVLSAPVTTDADKVALTRAHTTSAQASPDWPNALDVQAAVGKWGKAADTLETNGKTVAALRKQLADAETQQQMLRLAWTACTRSVLIAVAIYCAGAAKTILGLGFGTRSKTSLGPLAMVEGLTSALGKLSGQALVAWTRGQAHHGFLVQHATDANNQATWSAPIPCTKTKMLLEGLPPGSTVYVRVCAIDPSQKGGQAPWSAWMAATAR